MPSLPFLQNGTCPWASEIFPAKAQEALVPLNHHAASFKVLGVGTPSRGVLNKDGIDEGWVADEAVASALYCVLLYPDSSSARC
jgi:hypothetical protein